MLGGLVGVIALALAWGGSWRHRSNAPQPDIAALEARIAKLESAQAHRPAMPKRWRNSRPRSKRLETGVKETSPKLADLADRVAQLETSLKAISQSASEGGSVASAAAIAQQIAEAEQRLDAKIAEALAKAEARQRLRACSRCRARSPSSRPRSAPSPRPSLGPAKAPWPVPISPRSPSASPSSRRRFRSSPPPSARRTPARSRRRPPSPSPICGAAVSDGRPYAAELDTISALAPSVGDLGVLPAYAEKGIPTVPELARSFAHRQGGRAGRRPRRPPAARLSTR